MLHPVHLLSSEVTAYIQCGRSPWAKHGAQRKISSRQSTLV